MRVIFLDFDGVINRCDTQMISGVWNQSKDTFLLPHEKDCVAALNELIRRTGAKIVISSSWRSFADWTQMGPALERIGVVGEVVGETPLPSQTCDRMRDLDLFERGVDSYERGMDIYLYLLDHPEVKEYIILDDASDMWRLVEHLVLTHPVDGFTMDDVEIGVAKFEKWRV